MKKLITGSTVLIILLIAFLAWWSWSISPADKSKTEVSQFVIRKGENPRDIAKHLKDEGLIKDPVAFFLLVRFLGLEKNLQVGSFRLTATMSAEQIARRFTQGTEDLWITALEGWRSEEILDYLGKTNSVWTATSEERALWRQSEGKLFPDTYLVPKDASLELIRSEMLANFDRRFTPEMEADSKKAGLTIDEVTIIASMVEREARHSADRPIVAGIILNRLDAGMGLDIDATIQYAIGFTQKDGWWKKSLTKDDLRFRSPYNTYLNAGLPPAPIANPGLAALKAVIYLTKSNYLYYLTDNEGIMHYSSTLEEHNRNVATYLQ